MMKHNFKAEYIEGEGIVVKDHLGDEVQVRYAGTSDNWTLYAYSISPNGHGFIGGWQAGKGCREKKRIAPKFIDLVKSINRGILYDSFDELPLSCGRS